MISGTFNLFRFIKAHALSRVSPLSILQLLTIPTQEEASTHTMFTEQSFTFQTVGAEFRGRAYMEKVRMGVSEAWHVNRAHEQGEALVWTRVSSLGKSSDIRTRSGCKLVLVCSHNQIKLLIETGEHSFL